MTVVLGFASFGLLMCLTVLLVEPEPIVGLGTTQRQDAETALYLAAFGLILPLALVMVPRLADRIAAGPNADALTALTGILVATLAAAFVAARAIETLSSAGGVGLLLALLCGWGIGAGLLLIAAGRARPSRILLRVAPLAVPIWALAGGVVFGGSLATAHGKSLSPVALALGALVAASLVLVFARRLGAPRVGRRAAIGLELLLVVLLLLVIPDLVVLSPEDPDPAPVQVYLNGVIQFHHDFLLGPANQVLGGGTMLVDTASQYGVGSILFLVGWFQLVPIGYGTFGLLDGLLTALYFLAGYLILRLAGSSRPLALGALGLAVMALVLNRSYVVGALPQEGPLRFGLPMALILVAVAGARRTAWSRASLAGMLIVLAVASVWSFEAFAVTAATFVAVLGFQAYLLPSGTRLRWLARRAALGIAACAGMHVVVAVGTLIRSGELPDWSQYLAFLDAFLFGNLGNLTYDVSQWSPSVAVGLAYFASAAALALLIRRHPSFVRRRPVSVLALTGLTAYGIVLLNYFVDRSADHVLVYVSLPALLLGALWLSVVLASPGLTSAVRTGALAFALAVAVLLLSVGWSSIGGRFERSALAYVIPGGDSLREARGRLWNFPPINARTPRGQDLLDRYLPGERRSVVLVRPELTNEVLLRSGRANRLPLANAVEDGFVEKKKKPALREAARELPAGTRVLLDDGALAALAAVKANPNADVADVLQPGAPTTPLQVYALREIDKRFTLRAFYRDEQGYVVVRLEKRR